MTWLLQSPRLVWMRDIQWKALEDFLDVRSIVSTDMLWREVHCHAHLVAAYHHRLAEVTQRGSHVHCDCFLQIQHSVAMFRIERTSSSRCACYGIHV